MKVYCPVCHKRYGQAKLTENEKVGFECECGTWLEVEAQYIRYIPLEKVEGKISYDTLHREVEARLDLDILKQRLTPNEVKLLDLMAEGYENEEIANLTKRSVQAVSQQFKKIQKKANE